MGGGGCGEANVCQTPLNPKFIRDFFAVSGQQRPAVECEETAGASGRAEKRHESSRVEAARDGEGDAECTWQLRGLGGEDPVFQ